MDCSPPGSLVHGILQARILEWVAIPFSRGSSWPRDQTQVSNIASRFFIIWPTRIAHRTISNTHKTVWSPPRSAFLTCSKMLRYLLSLYLSIPFSPTRERAEAHQALWQLRANVIWNEKIHVHLLVTWNLELGCHFKFSDSAYTLKTKLWIILTSQIRMKT